MRPYVLLQRILVKIFRNKDKVTFTSCCDVTEADTTKSERLLSECPNVQLCQICLLMSVSFRLSSLLAAAPAPLHFMVDNF